MCKILEIMKATWRYLLIVTMLSVASLVFATAQSLAQQPEVQMHSTSMMVGTGSSLPQAAVTGVTTTSNQDSDGPRNGHVRKIGGGNSGGGDGPTNPVDPFATPIGDAAWPLMMLALAYVCVRGMRRRVED